MVRSFYLSDVRPHKRYQIPNNNLCKNIKPYLALVAAQYKVKLLQFMMIKAETFQHFISHN